MAFEPGVEVGVRFLDAVPTKNAQYIFEIGNVQKGGYFCERCDTSGGGTPIKNGCHCRHTARKHRSLRSI